MHTCSKCNKPVHALGLCNNHYRLYRRQDAVREPCKYCSALEYARGLCLVHYNRLLRHGDPNLVLCHINRGTHCIDCLEPATRLGRCKAHHERYRRLEVIKHYGGKCVCCGETEVNFLTLDHANGDGAAHRRTYSGRLHNWIIRHGFPPEFQLLCWNCNWAKAMGGCPHRGLAPIYAATHSSAIQQEYRRQVLAAYGNHCVCCEEATTAFLVMDHIDGEGNQHRRELRTNAIYPAIISEKFPNKYQILCRNCNWGKFIGGCPHKLAA